MKREIEARLLDLDAKKLIEKLKECGAEFKGDWLQLRYCYDFNPRRENSWVRLRTNGKETTLTIKEIESTSIDGTKELEVVVSDFYEMDGILNKLGYKARSKQENRRIRFMLGGVEIDIDFWPLIPTYAEFEGESEDDIKNVCNLLEIDFNNLTTLDVASIYGYYGYGKEAMNSLVLEEDRKESLLSRGNQNE